MTTYFPEVKKPIRYEGPDSRNPLAFKWYKADRKVGGKTMAQHLKFAVAYWHTFKGTGADPFGGPVYDRPWDVGATPLEVAHNTLDAAFEFITKLGAPYYCFHDRDIAPEGDTIAETNRNLDDIVKRAKRKQRETGVKLLWGTACLFAHPRYTHGAASNPDPHVFAMAASQVKRALEATVELGGTGYVFWGGREGYISLLNTNMKQEREQIAALFHLAVDHAKKIGFKGMFFVEPKAKEPSNHQYDFDAAHTLNFLREFGLMDRFMLNIEANHATLATHSFEHELVTAAGAGKLGSLDINRGEEGVGWDTDNFAMDARSCTLAMSIILAQRGLRYGGLNFDAKVRRGSFDTIDLFYAHVAGMDAFARGLLVAQKLKDDGVLDQIVRDRYAGWRRGMGRKILQGKTTLTQLETWAARQGEPAKVSGRQEMIEGILNDYLYATKID